MVLWMGATTDGHQYDTASAAGSLAPFDNARRRYVPSTLENIDNTKRIAAVVLNGRYLSRADLDTLLNRAAAIVRR